MVRPRPEVPVEAFGDPVQTLGRVGRENSWGGIAFARGQFDLARRQQFGGGNHPGAVRLGLGPVDLIPAPAQVHRPHAAVTIGESGGSGDGQKGTVRGGTPPPVFPGPGTHRERVALRRPLTTPATTEIHDLDGG